MKSENLKFCKVRKVKTPRRAHFDDAGIDFYVPEDLTYGQMKERFDTTSCCLSIKFLDKDENTGIDDRVISEFHLRPGESILIPSGIKLNIPKGFAVVAFNKSGVASKHGLLVGACVCDESYTGEIHINLHNTSKQEQIIKAGDKIVQFLVIPINYCELEEIDTVENLYKNTVNSGRGENGFGSTNDKN